MKTPHKGGILEAGKQAELAVTVFDQYGNVTADLAGHSVEATAHGPATVPFVETAAGVYRSAQRLTILSDLAFVDPEGSHEFASPSRYCACRHAIFRSSYLQLSPSRPVLPACIQDFCAQMFARLCCLFNIAQHL